jgi:hypothetical protein
MGGPPVVSGPASCLTSGDRDCRGLTQLVEIGEVRKQFFFEKKTLVSGPLSRKFLLVYDYPRFLADRCWGGFELAAAFPDHPAGRAWP